MNNTEYRLLYTIYNYYLYLYNVNIHLTTKNNKKVSIRFKEKDFIKLMGLGDYFKHDNGGSCNDINVIIRNICNGMINPEDYDYFNKRCDYLNKVLKLNLNTMKSVVLDEGKKYVMVKNDRNTVLIKIIPSRNHKYDVVDIMSTSEIKNKPVYVDSLKECSYVDLGGKPNSFMDNCGIIFTSKRRDLKFTNEILPKTSTNMKASLQ